MREFLNQKLQLHVAALLRWAAARADHESAKVEYRRRWLKLLHQEPVLPDREQFLRETYEQLMSDVTLLHLRKIGSPVQPLHPEVKAWLQPHYDQHCTDWRGDGEEPYEWEDWLEEWFDPEYCGVQMPIWVAHAFKRGVNYGRCDETGMVDA